jgi:hypothetical protein
VDDKNLVSLVGGLGNQLFQLANAFDRFPNEKIGFVFELGRDDKNSTDHESPLMQYRLENTYKSKMFQDPSWITLRFHNMILRTLGNTEIIYRVLAAILKFRLSQFMLKWVFSGYRVEISSDCQNLEIANIPTLQIGYFQGRDWSRPQNTYSRMVELELLNPSQTYLDAVEILVNEDFLVVHMRFGDYEKEKKFGIPESSYFYNAINLAISQSSFSKIVVFTNDETKARQANIDLLFEIETIYLGEDFECSPAETLELMRLGSAYVISNSTFSWWAAFLSKTDAAFVVCPQPWFIHILEPVELIPSHWVRLPSR